jgi:hypothetical protein
MPKLYISSMSDTHLLQTIIDGQVEIRNEIIKLGDKLDQTEGKLTTRIDALGKQLNILDEDAPTSEDLQNIDKRVKKLEDRVFSY